MQELDPTIIDELASGYVLGTLTHAERIRVKGLIRSNPAVEQAVIEWQNRLLPLASSVPPVAPSPRVWEAIDASVTQSPYNEKTTKKGWMHWVGLKSVAALAMGIMLGVGTTLLVLRSESVPESYVGFLTAIGDSVPVMHAAARRKESELFVKMIEPLTDRQNLKLVLWGVSADGPPRPLGVVQASGKTRITLDAPADITFKNVTVLAVSYEPAGDPLPTTPSGEYVLKGPCVKLW